MKKSPESFANTLYYGDCAKMLSKLPEKSVDLIYLDPPFNSKANYNVLYETKEDRSQVEAFSDTWTWGSKSGILYETLSVDPDIGDCVRGLKSILGRSGMLNYLMYMAVRLLLMRRVLKDTGSIYLHCDPHASHYLKIVMDAVFGKKNFKNEIVWGYKWGGVPRRDFARKHDIILRFSKNTEKYYFNDSAVREPYETKDKRWHNNKDGKILRDLWDDIPTLNTQSKERLRFETQKPKRLLERIIQSSCPEDGIVLDPFSGCGTTVSAAENLKRKWIGIDISYLAVDLTKKRLQHEYKGKYKSGSIRISGIPSSLKGAEDLFCQTIATYGKTPSNLDEAFQLAQSGDLNAKHKRNSGRFEFQRWACGIIDAFPKDREIGDGGVDGILLWRGAENGEVVNKWGAVEVKSSEKVTTTQLRALRGVISNGEDYVAGIIISMRKTESNEIKRICNNFEETHWEHHSGKKFPKLQVYSIEEYFEGKKPDMPTATAVHRIADIIKERHVDLPTLF